LLALARGLGWSAKSMARQGQRCSAV